MFRLRDEGDVGRLRSLLTLAGRLEPVTGDAAVMHEEVLRPLGRGDEPVALRIVEPLHGSFCHGNTPPLLLSRTRKEGARRADRTRSSWHNGSSRPAGNRPIRGGGRGYAQGRRAQVGGRSRRNHSTVAYACLQSEVSSATLAP